MSSTTENLLVQIQTLELQLTEARNMNDPVRIMYIENQLLEAKKRLTKASTALNENKTILKG